RRSRGRRPAAARKGGRGRLRGLLRLLRRHGRLDRGADVVAGAQGAVAEDPLVGEDRAAIAAQLWVPLLEPLPLLHRPAPVVDRVPVPVAHALPALGHVLAAVPGGREAAGADGGEYPPGTAAAVRAVRGGGGHGRDGGL